MFTHMSIDEQEQRLRDVQRTLHLLEQNIEQLKTEQRSKEAYIVEYNNSGFISKRLKKKEFEQAVERKMEIVRLINDAEKKVVAHQAVIQKHKKELETTRALQVEIAGIHVTETLAYWQSKHAQNEAKVKECDAQIPKILQDISNAKQLIDQTDKDVTRLRRSCAPLFTAQEKYNQIKNDLWYELEKKRKLEADLKAKLDTELEKCALLYSRDGRLIAQVVSDLKRLKANVTVSLIGVNLSELEAKEEVCKKQIAEIQEKLNEIEKKLEQLEHLVIAEAKIIGTTLAKSYLSDELQLRKFDTVILDEASMASIPALWCASCVAEKNIVIVGDFLQLPPIVIAETPAATTWLGTDIFEKSGVKGRLDRKQQPSNFVMLNQQFRMEKEIADVASELYYKKYGALISNDKAPLRVAAREKFHEWYNGNTTTPHSIHLVNTESLNTWVTGVQQGSGCSRMNYFTATLDVNMAFKLIENRLEDENIHDPLVLIITPYRPQVDIIQKMIRCSPRPVITLSHFQCPLITPLL